MGSCGSTVQRVDVVSNFDYSISYLPEIGLTKRYKKAKGAPPDTALCYEDFRNGPLTKILTTPEFQIPESLRISTHSGDGHCIVVIRKVHPDDPLDKVYKLRIEHTVKYKQAGRYKQGHINRNRQSC